jgi:(p)ppGpp synthase/HD superfamily hydrolase
MESKAMEYAVRWHHISGQTYDGFPYARHLQMVVTIAKNYLYYIDNDNKENVLASCCCHDLIEDTRLTKKHLSDYLNHQIAEIVFAVTNEQALSRTERNIKTFSKIGNSKLAIFVKLCDRIANTTNSKISAREKFDRYASEFQVFKYYLQNSQRLYPNMWQELENLYC